MVSFMNYVNTRIYLRIGIKIWKGKASMTPKTKTSITPKTSLKETIDIKPKNANPLSDYISLSMDLVKLEVFLLEKLDIDKLDNVMESTIWTDLSKKTILEFLVKGILTLSEDEKNVIYLRVFNFPTKTLSEIQDITNIDKQLLSRVYRRAIKKIKK